MIIISFSFNLIIQNSDVNPNWVYIMQLESAPQIFSQVLNFWGVLQYRCENVDKHKKSDFISTLLIFTSIDFSSSSMDIKSYWHSIACTLQILQRLWQLVNATMKWNRTCILAKLSYCQINEHDSLTVAKLNICCSHFVRQHSARNMIEDITNLKQQASH